jgi:hypothetical protein
MQNQYGIVEYNQYGLGKAFRDTKVGGFFGRLFKRIKDSKLLMAIPIIAAIASIGDTIMGAIETVESWRISDPTLTPQEQTILDLFDTNLFTPFYISLLKEAQGIFSSGISLDEQISRTNIILAKICAVEKHFTATPAPFLSANALQIRNEYISETLGVIELYIFQQFKLQNFAKVVVTRNMSDYFFDGLMTKTAITTFT